jgi:hypothetical protein
MFPLCSGVVTCDVMHVHVCRCKACLASTTANNIVITIDNGRWYAKKVQEAAAALIQPSTSAVTPLQDAGRTADHPPCVPVLGWKPFPSKSIPSGFCYGSVYEHIISTAVLLPAGGVVESGGDDYSTGKPMRKGREYFRSGFVVDIEDCARLGHYFIKAGVYASYRQLFAIEDYTIAFGFEPIARTSQLCALHCYETITIRLYDYIYVGT